MELKDYLKEIKSISEEKAQLISGYFKKETITKGTLLLQEGKISKKSYFLQSGIVRCYVIDLNGNEVTTRFFSAPDFLNDYLSYFKQKPSEENYEAITDCDAWGIDFKDMQYCFHNIPEFREWGRMLLTLNYVSINKKMLSFYKNTAQERYLELLKEHPEIIQQVPLHMIASYLGVTKYSLSRIRKETAQKLP